MIALSPVIFKSAILLLWLLFSVWCYLLLVYFLGMIWIFHKPKGKIYFTKSILTVVLGLILLNGLVQGVMIYFYVSQFAANFDSKDDPIKLKVDTVVILFSILAVSFILSMSQLLCFFFLTNNLIVQISSSQLSLLGLTIYFSSITELTYSKSKYYWIIKYVYKQEKSMIWQEKVRFFAKFKLTKILQKELAKFIDVKKNQELFDMVASPKTAQVNPKPKTKTTEIK